MTDLNPKRTAMKANSTSVALAGEAKARALYYGHEAVLAGNEAAKIQARNQSYLTAQTEAMARQETHKAILAQQKQTGYVGDV